MKALTIILISAMAAGALVACNGGGSGGTSTGGVYFSHKELAEDFVYRLTVDRGWDVDLVKSNIQHLFTFP